MHTEFPHSLGGMLPPVDVVALLTSTAMQAARPGVSLHVPPPRPPPNLSASLPHTGRVVTANAYGLPAASKKRDWSEAFPMTAERFSVSPNLELHERLAALLAQQQHQQQPLTATAMHNPVPLHILSHLVSSQLSLPPSVGLEMLKSLPSYSATASYVASLYQSLTQQEASRSTLPVHPSSLDPYCNADPHPLLALISRCSTSSAHQPGSDALLPLSSHHSHEMLPLALHLKAVSDGSQEATEPSSSPPQPTSPKGFQDYHKVVSSMPPALQARLRKKIRIIQPISKTWQAEACQPPADDATQTPNPTPNPARAEQPSNSAPPTGFREYRKQQPSNESTSTIRTDNHPSSHGGDASSRSMSSSPSLLNLEKPPRPPSLSAIPSSTLFSQATTSSLTGVQRMQSFKTLSTPPPAPSCATLPSLPPPSCPPVASLSLLHSLAPSANTQRGINSLPASSAPAFQSLQLQHVRPPSPLSGLPAPCAAQPAPSAPPPASIAATSPLQQLPSPSLFSLPQLPAPLPAAANGAALSTVQCQLSILYQWYIHSKGAYLEEAKRLLTVIDQEESNNDGKGSGMDNKAVLRAFDKAIQIMRATQAYENQLCTPTFSQKSAQGADAATVAANVTAATAAVAAATTTTAVAGMVAVPDTTVVVAG